MTSSVPLTPPRPGVSTSDASTLVAETESSDTTLHREELEQRLWRDYESDERWVLEGSKGDEQVQRAFDMVQQKLELANRFGTLAGKLAAAHDGAKKPRSHDGT